MDNISKLDRTAFSALSLEEADLKMNDYSPYTREERFTVFHYLNSVSYRYPMSNPPRMEKIFSGTRNLNDGINSQQ
jgi:hypothetical protein